MYQHLYTRFLEGHRVEVETSDATDRLGSRGYKLHLAAHSHHFWPDVVREAQLEYFDLAARYSDQKWSHILSEKVPELQNQIAEILGIAHPKKIAFAQNTHDLILRIFSCKAHLKRKLRVLTTDSEFYSFDRQASKLSDLGFVELVKVPQFPIESFEQRFLAVARETKFDFYFLSHVFFNSGLAVDLDLLLPELLQTAKQCDAHVILDAYHAFMALPISLKPFDELIYIAGSYKYAQAGEGCCFAYIPDENLTPAISGWFATLGDDHRFAGSTMDYSGVYRLSSVLKLLKSQNLSVEKIHDYVLGLQNQFLVEFDELVRKESTKIRDTAFEKLDFSRALCESKRIVRHDGKPLYGHFFSYSFSHLKNATEWSAFFAKECEERNVLIDFRKDIVRFGFGLYQVAPFELDKYFSSKNS